MNKLGNVRKMRKPFDTGYSLYYWDPEPRDRDPKGEQVYYAFTELALGYRRAADCSDSADYPTVPKALKAIALLKKSMPHLRGMKFAVVKSSRMTVQIIQPRKTKFRLPPDGHGPEEISANQFSR